MVWYTNLQCHVVEMLPLGLWMLRRKAPYCTCKHTTQCSAAMPCVLSIVVLFLSHICCYCVCFLCPLSQAEAQTRLSADGAPRAPSLANQVNPSSSSIYPPTQRMTSGVYSLLSYGFVPHSHPEHPDTFIPQLMKREAEAFGSGASTKTGARRENFPGVPVLHRPSGGWSSGFGRTLEDAYRNGGAAAPRFTTKTRCTSVVPYFEVRVDILC